jgi:hypothetical protein
MSRLSASGAILLICLIMTTLAPVDGDDLLADEELLESDQEAFDPQEILERLAQLRSSPLDPNRASHGQLRQIPYLSAQQVQGILALRKRHRLKDLDDLLLVPEIDVATLARIRPFLRIRAARRDRVQLRSRGIVTWPLARGYRQGAYPGLPLKLYLKLNLSAGERISLGLLGEKDPGEENMADFCSGHVQLEDLGPLRRAVVGDFALEFGQGLVLWTGGGPAGGARSPGSVRRRPRGTRSYTSADENKGLRGLALTGVLGPMDLSAFVSRRLLDASLDGETARGFDVSGLHRTALELTKRDVIEESLVGGHLGISPAHGQVAGLTWYHSRYRPGLNPDDLRRRRYAFRGMTSQVWGAHWELTFRSLAFYGEGAVTAGGARAFTSGLSMELEPIRTILAWRHFEADYSNPRGSGLAAKESQNETGMLLGMIWRAGSKTRVELLVDGYRRPWRSYLLEMPSAGTSWTLQVVQRLGRGGALTVRHKRRQGDVPAAGPAGINKNGRRDQSWWRFQLDWRMTAWLEMRSRAELNRVFNDGQGKAARSALLLAQFKIRSGNMIDLKWIITIFRVPTYDCRLYLCEVGPAGTARNMALFGRGSRLFLLIQLKKLKGTDLSLRLCRSLFDDRQTIGSGWDRIEGRAKTELLMQVDWRW